MPSGNEEVRAKIQQAIGPQEDLPIVKRRKLQWYGHVSSSSGLAKTISQGTVSDRGEKTSQTEDEVGKQHQGNWSPASSRGQWRTERKKKKEKEETGCKVICGASTMVKMKVDFHRTQNRDDK